jgi:hypothetical protein
MDGGSLKGIVVGAGARSTLIQMCAGGSDAARVLADLLIEGVEQPTRGAGPNGDVFVIWIEDPRGPMIVAFDGRTVAALVRPTSEGAISVRRGTEWTYVPAQPGDSLASWFDEERMTVDAHYAVVEDVRDITKASRQQRLDWLQGPL